MKRTLRWTFNGLTALSLLLCLAGGALWLFSYYASADVWQPLGRPSFYIGERELTVSLGAIRACRCELSQGMRAVDPLITAPSYQWERRGDGHFDSSLLIIDLRPRRMLSRVGIEFSESDFTANVSIEGWFNLRKRGVFGWTSGRLVTGQLDELRLPIALLVAPFAILPLLRLTRWVIRRLLRPRGDCRSCGYDLRGNLSGVCPECGSAIPPPRVPPADARAV